MTLNTEGEIKFDGFSTNVIDVIAGVIRIDIAIVEKAIAALMTCGLITICESGNYYIPYVLEHTGSETQSARYKRAYRRKKNTKVELTATSDNIDFAILDRLENVSLTKEDYLSLLNEYPNDKVDKAITDAEGYCKRKGISYTTDPAAAIRKFLKNQKIEPISVAANADQKTVALIEEDSSAISDEQKDLNELIKKITKGL
jgi:hypothetical protein